MHVSKRQPKIEDMYVPNLIVMLASLYSGLNDESYALLLYLLLQGNSNVASFIFSRSDIEQLVSQNHMQHL